jgi:hypothetical protein
MMIGVPPMQLNGVRVTIVQPMRSERMDVRPWKERLFTRPFNPFRTHKKVTVFVDALKDGEIINSAHGLCMNAKTWHDLSIPNI